jgi:hypothetical protein
MARTRFYCNICRNSTWHEIMADHEQAHHNYFWGADKLFRAQILQCCGCDYFSFCLTEHPFEFEENGEVTEHIFPTREYKKREQKFFFSLPRTISKAYRQTNEAFDHELYLLAAIGLRTLVEAIVDDRLPETEYSSSIQSKIEALRKYFSDDVIGTLHDFRFMGNKAVHSLEEPERLDIHRALNVIENIMAFFYGVEESARSYKKLKEPKSQG